MSQGSSEGSSEELYRALNERYFGPNMDEEKEIESLPKLLGDCRVFVDVGASLGQYTHRAQATLENARIFAIEADPVRFTRLAELCEEWAASPRNNAITPMNLAVSDENGPTNFFTTDRDQSGGLFPPDEETDGKLEWEEVTVQAATLDSLFLDDVPDLVKMDIEGGEWRAIHGSRGLLALGKTRFLVEVHPWGDPTVGKRESDLFDLFLEAGYDFKRLHRHWLFVKSNGTLVPNIKNKLIHLLLDHRAIRNNVRKLVRTKR